jgi:hypothetical protein
MCRGVSWVLAALAYFGLLLAPSVVLNIPFELMRGFALNPASGSYLAYWVVAAGTFTVALWALYRIGAVCYRNFRRGVIELEAAVAFVGVVLATFLASWRQLQVI